MIKIDKKKCLRCGACVSACPFLALELTEHGVIYNKDRCRSCKICVSICPVGAIKYEEDSD
jgi:Fe-S-cluster-containing hydrogenase component 2